MRKIYPA